MSGIDVGMWEKVRDKKGRQEVSENENGRSWRLMNMEARRFPFSPGAVEWC